MISAILWTNRSPNASSVNARDAGINVACESDTGGQNCDGNADRGREIQALTSSWYTGECHRFCRKRRWTQLLAALGPLSGIDPAPLPDAASPEQIYERERTVVGSFRIVPLVWLPQVYGLNARVRDWKPPAPGETWPLADVWLDAPCRFCGRAIDGSIAVALCWRVRELLPSLRRRNRKESL